MRLTFLFILLFTQSAMAIENPYLMRSARALLMGDAFTAVNDDEFTLFYNPASMGRHRRDFSMTPINFQLSGNNLLEDMKSFSNMPQDPVQASRLLLNKPVHAGVGTAPGFKLFNVGVNVIAHDSYDLLLRNRTHPMLDLDLRADRGIIIGAGMPLGPGRISRRSMYGSQTTLGFSTKYIERTGVRDSLALTGPTFTGALGKDELRDVLNQLGRVRGIGWGFDAGLEHVHRDGNKQLVLGLSALDITHTKFRMDPHPDNLKVANTSNQINLGVAGGQDHGYFNYILSADIRSLQQEMDFSRRLRLGAQVGIPGIKFMGGINSGYYSYGAMLDLSFMKLTAGFYGQELGSSFRQIKSKRFILYLSLFDFSFDA